MLCLVLVITILYLINIILYWLNYATTLWNIHILMIWFLKNYGLLGF